MAGNGGKGTGEESRPRRSLLKAKGTFAGPEEAASRRTNWEALEAARLLATHAEITASLLLARADGMRGADAKEVYYAMGRCSTDKAVEALRHRALAETNYWMAASLVYALAAAGEKGDAVLRDMENSAQGNLKACLGHHWKVRIGDKDENDRYTLAVNGCSDRLDSAVGT